MPRFSLRQVLLLVLSTVLFLTTLTLRRSIYEHDNTLISKPKPTRKTAQHRPQHYFHPNGFLETNMKGRHPIHDLFESGQRRWEDMLQSQSTTLSQAVTEYERRYHRLPPRGFDLWWQFAQDSNVLLVDEFDQINYDIEPYLALPPVIFNERADKLIAMDFQFSLHIASGRISVTGARNEDVSPKTADLVELIKDFAHLLPNLTVHGSDHDRGNILLGSDQRAAAVTLARSGRSFTQENLTYFESPRRNQYEGLVNACSKDDGVFSEVDSISRPDSRLFIHDHIPTMDFCHNPVILQTQGDYANDHTHENKLEPKLVHSKWRTDSSLLLPALPGFDDAPTALVPWSKRDDNRLFWRARATGTDFMYGDWRKAHRTRLHFLGNSDEGERAVLIEDRESGLSVRHYPLSLLNKKFVDVGLVPPLVQCYGSPAFCSQVESEIGWRDVVPMQRTDSAKFVMDVDGNGWSQRFRRLMASGSVVFKSTIYPEWNSHWLIPFFHYVPIQADYADLYDCMAFFVGAPQGDGTDGHDEMAQEIAQNAVKFVRDHWRWEDMQAYMFRLLLEYARLASLDRDAMTYHP